MSSGHVDSVSTVSENQANIPVRIRRELDIDDGDTLRWRMRGRRPSQFITGSVQRAHMADSESTTSPLEAAAGRAGPHAVDTFELLGNETRLAILLALWEAWEPHGSGNAVPFSELRDRVGIRQGAQFNYHLDRLLDQFVRKTNDGYTLRRAGRRLVQSIIAGTGIEEPELEPTEIDANCPYCGATTAVTYDNVYVYQVCTECDGDADPGDIHPTGTILGWTFEPTGLSGRTAEEVLAASTLKTFARIVLRFASICPDCSGAVSWSVDVCDAHDSPDDGRCPNCNRRDPVQVQEVCRVCKSAGHGNPSIKVLFHPAVVSFYYDRGIELGFTGDISFTDALQALEIADSAEETAVSTDPLRVRVRFIHDGDRLDLHLDAEMNVVETQENEAVAHD